MKLKFGPYSPSRLDTGICGYAFHKQYITKEAKSPENLPQARGSAVHEVFEMITKKMVENPNYVFSQDEVRQWVTEAINRHPPAYEEIDAIHTMAREFIRKPPKILTSDAGIELKLAIKWKKNPDGSFATYQDVVNMFDWKSKEPIPTQVTRPLFEECDYNDPEAFARGRADILLISDDTTKAIIYDHKTQPNIEEADTFQMGFYAWVISRYYPFLSEISTIMHFARYAYYSDPYVWTKENLYQIENQVLDRVHNIESRTEWGAVPNNKCQYCPILTKCPAMQEFVQVDESGHVRTRAESYKIFDTQHAVKIAGLINVLENVLETAKDELKVFVKHANFPIAIPGKVYEYRSSEESINWDKANKDLRPSLLEIFKKYNVDPMLFMGFSQTFSKSVWMLENEALVKELAAILPRKKETTFKGWKQ